MEDGNRSNSSGSDGKKAYEDSYKKSEVTEDRSNGNNGSGDKNYRVVNEGGGSHVKNKRSGFVFVFGAVLVLLVLAIFFGIFGMLVMRTKEIVETDIHEIYDSIPQETIPPFPENEHEFIVEDINEPMVIEEPFDEEIPVYEGDVPIATITESEVFSNERHYKIGVDLERGQYILISTSSTDYAAFDLTADSRPTGESRIAADTFKGSSIVTVEDGQYLYLKDCEPIPANRHKQEAENGVWGSGMYRIGIDIPAGEYKVVPNPGQWAYFKITASDAHNFDSIITNDYLTAEKYMTFDEGTYLVASDLTIHAN